MENIRGIHSSLGHQKTEMRVEINPVPERLYDRNNAGRQSFPGRDFKISVQSPQGRAAKFAQQPTLVLEERPQHLGNHKDDLAMRDIPKQPFPHPFAPYLDALGLA